ncbi:MAG: hypothetical protein A3J48_04225 [Candidatus Doudnabacteria bacterium RIFCSPHIGHO2_02_FULL_46_11]|uniref:Glucose/Sorbosone dehydrogenase domain-containing protein n=1 Tax=Candidatus Doudnabacteria bacterium RIFCSPHIGHO2_02_FULL_46_11 TaxID=1817832 RepID=A0A1F5P538_9BACT|nr:MAG: hypothetical protein A3J48_04225 [Candidatus Doudnabacteria bacterium RIFCSPHIGHO2_02_FULL_46_11]
MDRDLKKALAALGLIALAVIAVVAFGDREIGSEPEQNLEQESEIPAADEGGADRVATVVAEGLDTPWEIVFLPDGDMLVTERPGVLRRIGKSPVEINVDGVLERGEGGLLGLALHPNFSENNLLYLYFTTSKNGRTINRVARYEFRENSLSNSQTLIDDLPGSSNHNGGRIVFGPDNYLYITTGDAGNSQSAQNINSLAGKILRLKDDGSIPPDNPFGNPVYSYGHRNPQGLAWDNSGNLWATEHGRSGAASGYDEINFIERGANYGWPNIEGSDTRDNMTAPVIHSGPSTTWAPAGLAFLDGRIYFAGLRGATLYSADVDGAGKLGPLAEYFKNEYGRLRAVTVGPDGLLYISTSNRDGRGQVKTGDDKIIKITRPRAEGSGQ